MSNVVRDGLVCAAPAATQSATVRITRIVLRRMRTTRPLPSTVFRYRGSTATPVISYGPRHVPTERLIGCWWRTLSPHCPRGQTSDRGADSPPRHLGTDPARGRRTG